MAFNMAEAFDSAEEQAAYEAFCAEQERMLESFELAEPALVCRWRMAGKHVPMLNRHIRALSQRTVNGAPLTHNVLSWVKQHIEWSVAEGDYATRDGVLMVVIDVNGHAAMSVGEYEPLADASAEALAARAEEAAREGAATGVAPEVLCHVEGNELVVDLLDGAHPCGVLTLVEQLASTRGLTVSRGAGVNCQQQSAFLVSDEHGIVPAEDALTHPFIQLCQTGYAKLVC